MAAVEALLTEFSHYLNGRLASDSDYFLREIVFPDNKLIITWEERLFVKASCCFVRLKRNGVVQRKQQSDISGQADWTCKLQHPQSIGHGLLGVLRCKLLKCVSLGERRADNHRVWLRARENFTIISAGLFSLSQNNRTPLKSPSRWWLTL